MSENQFENRDKKLGAVKEHTRYEIMIAFRKANVTGKELVGFLESSLTKDLELIRGCLGEDGLREYIRSVVTEEYQRISTPGQPKIGYEVDRIVKIIMSLVDKRE